MGANHKFGQRSISRMEGVSPLLKEWAKRLLIKSPFDLTIPYLGGYRTAEEQNGLYENGQGVTQKDGYVKKSYHQSGNALDIVIAGKTIEAMYNIEKLDYLGKLGFEVWQEMEQEDIEVSNYKLTWGGSWRWKDRPHWQIKRKS